jgi:hypothetical protein
VCATMDIEEFYDGDPRRRASAEIELGNEWQDSHGVHYELNYIEDTGELYVMQEPPPKEWVDPFGGMRFNSDPKTLAVRVVAKVDSVDLLHSIVQGWQEAMTSDNSADWLAERLRVAGVATNPADGG